MRGLEEEGKVYRDSKGHSWLSLQSGRGRQRMGRDNGGHESSCLSLQPEAVLLVVLLALGVSF